MQLNEILKNINTKKIEDGKYKFKIEKIEIKNSKTNKLTLYFYGEINNLEKIKTYIKYDLSSEKNAKWGLTILNYIFKKFYSKNVDDVEYIINFLNQQAQENNIIVNVEFSSKIWKDQNIQERRIVIKDEK